uniref:Uncharacterized protein n=1 Tax=Plectus sambesii TaxID=2011161 RepID=A0A914XD75_9BILA
MPSSPVPCVQEESSDSNTNDFKPPKKITKFVTKCIVKEEIKRSSLYYNDHLLHCFRMAWVQAQSVALDQLC